MNCSDPGIPFELWPIRPPPQDEEVFSGWLARIGQAHGITPRQFVSQLRANAHAGNRDLDSHPSYELIAEVSRRTSIRYARIVKMTLRWHAVAPMFSSGSALLSADTFAYCPLCWVNDPVPYVRRAWRLTWMPVCMLHRVLLSEFCPRCRRVPCFQELAAYHLLCVCTCRFDLRDAPPPEWPSRHSALDIERLIDTQGRRFHHLDASYAAA